MSGIMVKYGLIGGLIAILSTLISYLFSNLLFEKLLLNSLIQLIMFVILIYIAIIGVREFRRLNNGIISFKESFTTALGVLFITFFLSVLFSLLLYQVIDPEYADKTKIAIMQSMEERFEKYPIDEEKKLEILESFEKRDFNFTLSKAGKSIASFTVISGIIALIIGWSIKKDVSGNSEIE